MYSIQEVSRKTGLSTHTLRYYEKAELLTGVKRSPRGTRQYSQEDLESLNLICCLKNTGMSIQDIGRFMKLTQQGDETLKQRVELLRAHRESVLDRVAQMQAYLDKVTCKLSCFSEKLRQYEEGINK